MDQDFEKLGQFYLGREYDIHAKKSTDALVMYDSKDLVTHAVCVGMTGSGKTGLCIGLLEEAAIDNIPAIVIDPKGDLSNLLLTFPELSASEFRPWINENDAEKKGLTPDQYADQQAKLWKDGLAQWGQTPERIQKLRDAADFVVYTPGSSAGRPVSILKSLSAPDESIIEDHDLLQERISTTVTSLLGLLGIDADPIQSREHILLSTLFNNAWKDGSELSLEKLITQIQAPPFGRVGVIDIDSFFPPKARSELAMKLNNLLAAPGFATWLAGDPLDINTFLYTAKSKPRISIFSISHLSDAERMFFVSLLLNQLIGWMRGQSGTTSLRAVLYMDEIFGYFPPVANPPSKGPLLTLMKQARAFGLGCVLATQNPVDIDYKGLSNAGTWFIGRLQTERDKMRVLDGLAGANQQAGAAFDRQKMSNLISSLGNRVFLLNNVHDNQPITFQTRWTLSYLRGPLTRNQLKTLMRPTEAQTSTDVPMSNAGIAVQRGEAAALPTVDEEDAPAQTATRSAAASPREIAPVLSPKIRQTYLPVRSQQPADATLVYKPGLLAFVDVYFQDTKANIDLTQPYTLTATRGGDGFIDWSAGQVVDTTSEDLDTSPAEDASFTPLKDDLSNPRNYDAWPKQVVDAVLRTKRIDLWKSDRYNQISKPGESDRDFRVRLSQGAREARDLAVEKLRQKFAPKQAQFEERLRRAQQAVEREKSQARTSTFQTAVSFGATVLGAFLGRKTMSAANIGKATTAARGVGRSTKEYSDVARATETVESVQAQQAELDAQFKREMADMEMAFDTANEPLTPLQIRPKKSNVTVQSITLSWTPYWQTPDGQTTSAWE